MLCLQPFNCPENLLDLIGFCQSFIILDVHSRVTDPWCFVNSMTAAGLTGLSEEMLTHLANVSKTNTGRVVAHLLHKFYYACHEANNINNDTACQWRKTKRW